MNMFRLSSFCWSFRVIFLWSFAREYELYMLSECQNSESFKDYVIAPDMCCSLVESFPVLSFFLRQLSPTARADHVVRSMFVWVGNPETKWDVVSPIELCWTDVDTMFSLCPRSRQDKLTARREWARERIQTWPVLTESIRFDSFTVFPQC